MSSLTVGSISGLASNNNVITVPSGHILKQSGAILQVISTTKTDTWTAAVSTPTDITGLSVVITPKLSTSKILLIANITTTTNTATTSAFRFTRNGSPIAIGDTASTRQRVTARAAGANTAWMNTVSMTFLDSPNSIAAQTYVVQGMGHNSGYTIYVNRSATDADTANGDDSRTVSTITAMEIAQ